MVGKCSSVIRMVFSHL